jgi:LysR family glycine cleavage system transcriptional activator
MKHHLPPLNALRAFEASARTRSFTKAADELGVTYGAISKQIVALEAYAGVKLFTRTRQGLALTPKGETFCRSIGNAFELIARSTAELKKQDGKSALRLKVAPTFALRWLVPRLARFHSANRNIEVRINTGHDQVNFDSDDVDALIQSDYEGVLTKLGSGSCRARRLFEEIILPVCSPALPKIEELKEPNDLRNHTLLSSLHRPHDWKKWLTLAGAPDLACEGGIRFENSALSYQAAIDKIGVSIAQWTFVQDELNAGRLVEPFNVRAATGCSYYLVYSDSHPKSESLEVFENWLLSEMGVSEQPAS